MPTNAEKIAAIRADAEMGRSIAVAEYLRVDWDFSTTNYYATGAWSEIPPFTGIGVTVEPRLIPSSLRDPFYHLELNSDLRSETITVKFDDIDKDISNKFRDYRSGIRCELFNYFPDHDLTISVWTGQLQAPQVYGWSTVEATITNGYRSRELFIPSRRSPSECTANQFGGAMATAEMVRSNLCRYDRHLGGSVGLLDPSTGQPFISCPQLTAADCERRFGNRMNFGGFTTDAAAVVTDNNNYYLATTRGNTSNLKEPLIVVFGRVNLRNIQLILWRREVNASTPANGWVATIWRLCEGPIRSVTNFAVGERITPAMHLNVRLGDIAQPPTSYAPNVSNYSKTAIVFARDGWRNAAQTNVGDLSASCIVEGFKDVRIYTDDDPITSTREYTTNRVWCLLEVYTNQTFGIGYAESRFDLASWMDAAALADDTVSTSILFDDGEEHTYISRRSQINAVLQGRPVGEQVEDICRAGGLTVPYLNNGKFKIKVLTALTNDELADVPVITDQMIVWEKDSPSLTLSQTPDNKIVNEVEVRFDDAANGGVERPFTIKDRNQQLKAGRQLGANHFMSVPKKYTAFGLESLAEAVRFARRLIKFGEFDSGGIDNNLSAKFTIPMIYALDLERYQIIKLDSRLLTGYVVGDGDLKEPAEYFRILHIKKRSNAEVELTCQAYNHTAYSSFETTINVDPPWPALTVTGAGSGEVNVTFAYVGQVDGRPSYVNGIIEFVWNDAFAQWQIRLIGGDTYYFSDDDVASPDLATTWEQGSLGIAPMPTVHVFTPPPFEPCRLELGTPTYDEASAALLIPIEPC